MSIRGDDLGAALLFAFGGALLLIGLITGEDSDLGLIFVVMASGAWAHSSLKRDIQELRYRIGELEHKIEQAGRGLGSQQGK
jgi:hypothetical protein